MLNDEIILLFTTMFVTTISGILWAWYIYKSVINPVSFKLFIGFFLVNSLSIISTLKFRINEIDDMVFNNFTLNDLLMTGWLSTLNVICFLIPFFVIPSKYNILMGNTIIPKSFLWSSHHHLGWGKFFFLILLLLLSFFFLMLSSNDPLDWILDPRNSYLFQRSGNGHFYLATVFFLLLSYIVCLFIIKPNKFNVIFLTFIFITLSFWTGKKAVMISFLLIGLLFYNFYIRKIKLFWVVVYSIFSFLLLIFLITFQGQKLNFDFVLNYFNYSDVPALMLARFDEFGFYLGRVFLTSFWVMVPRAIYPDKPFEYGDSLIHAVLFPGMTETGHTSGYLIWSGLYLDFGIVGIIMGGILEGILVKMIFDYFVFKNRSIILFMLVIHICFVPIWFFLPLIFVLIWLYFCSITLRSKFI